jgi:hypothetical protein
MARSWTGRTAVGELLDISIQAAPAASDLSAPSSPSIAARTSRVSLVNAGASTVLNVLTLAAELGGVSLVLQMATGISYLIWVQLAGLAAWLVIWKMPFGWMENIFGLLGWA